MRFEVETLVSDPRARTLLGDAETFDAALAIAMHAIDALSGGVQIVEKSQDSRVAVMRYRPRGGGLQPA
jgi:hypothetical protein